LQTKTEWELAQKIRNGKAAGGELKQKEPGAAPLKRVESNHGQAESMHGRDSVQEKMIQEINSLDAPNQAPRENNTSTL
jgi:hypothetical protein